MSRIDIGEVHAFLYQLKSVNETGKKEIQAIKTVVTDYVDEASLKGKAIDASKRYYQATYFSLCDALIEAMNESEERLSQYIRDFQEEVDSSLDTKIDADGLYELGKMIDRIEGKKEALAQQMNSGSEGTMQNYRSELATAYKKEDMLEKYISFEQGHGNFFDTLTDLVQSVLRMVNELGSNIQFNSQTGTYDMSKLDIQSLERMRQALDKAKDNEVTINFDDYQKTYQGHTWILMKDGKVDAEATDAYNEAIINGTLPKETNAATQEAELLKSILASLKNKKDPITGADISSMHVLSILSGLAFSYTAKKYIGKKLRIPNPNKRKKKEKKGKEKKEKDGGVVLSELDKKLIAKLEKDGVKISKEDVIRIKELPDDEKIIWLEKGNPSAGFEHILIEHGEQFAKQGISKAELPDFLMTALEKGKIVGYQGKGEGRPIYEVVYNGKKHRVAITVGKNGFIVGANPVSIK
ncbi:T7SS effector LXG polymorphic toxin [Listeria seeligeri]|uniref:T7SS effector LXG polymorphic toxin n=1 Tax=Listeria seeligeri TaxID=1640 RepID=UPI001EF2887D|nr:T7SS effector LXG polymorphic toxin [Listeria seeligeri]